MYKKILALLTSIVFLLSLVTGIAPSFAADDSADRIPITFKNPDWGKVDGDKIKWIPQQLSVERFLNNINANKGNVKKEIYSSDGVSVITESIFENRFMHVPEFKRMGADVSLSDSNAIVKGCSNFSGAPVMASDLRASAGLVIAALMADNSSEIQRIYHLDRGYEGFERKLSALGADIRRIRSEK